MAYQYTLDLCCQGPGSPLEVNKILFRKRSVLTSLPEGGQAQSLPAGHVGKAPEHVAKYSRAKKQ